MPDAKKMPAAVQATDERLIAPGYLMRISTHLHCVSKKPDPYYVLK